MKNVSPFLILSFLAVTLFSGCATVTRGTNDTLVVESDPPGAAVTLSNGMRDTTPATFKLPRKNNVSVRIERDGYEPVEIEVKSQISGAGGAGLAGNVLIGGLIGAGVDVVSGAMNDLKPNPISVNLVPLNAKPAIPKSEPPSPEVSVPAPEVNLTLLEADAPTPEAEITIPQTISPPKIEESDTIKSET